MAKTSQVCVCGKERIGVAHGGFCMGEGTTWYCSEGCARASGRCGKWYSATVLLMAAFGPRIREAE